MAGFGVRLLASSSLATSLVTPSSRATWITVAVTANAHIGSRCAQRRKATTGLFMRGWSRRQARSRCRCPMLNGRWPSFVERERRGSLGRTCSPKPGWVAAKACKPCSGSSISAVSAFPPRSGRIASANRSDRTCIGLSTPRSEARPSQKLDCLTHAARHVAALVVGSGHPTLRLVALGPSLGLAHAETTTTISTTRPTRATHLVIEQTWVAR